MNNVIETSRIQLQIESFLRLVINTKMRYKQNAMIGILCSEYKQIFTDVAMQQQNKSGQDVNQIIDKFSQDKEFIIAQEDVLTNFIDFVILIRRDYRGNPDVISICNEIKNRFSNILTINDFYQICNCLDQYRNRLSYAIGIASLPFQSRSPSPVTWAINQLTQNVQVDIRDGNPLEIQRSYVSLSEKIFNLKNMVDFFKRFVAQESEFVTYSTSQQETIDQNINCIVAKFSEDFYAEWGSPHSTICDEEIFVNLIACSFILSELKHDELTKKISMPNASIEAETCVQIIKSPEFEGWFAEFSNKFFSELELNSISAQQVFKYILKVNPPRSSFKVLTM